MGKLVVLELGREDIEHFFPVTLQIGEEGKRPDFRKTGKLRCDPSVEKSYKNWQNLYLSLKGASGSGWMGMKRDSSGITHLPVDEKIKRCKQSGKEFQHNFNNWLQQSEFRPIRDEFLHKLDSKEDIRIIIQADNNSFLQQLPWNLWDILNQYEKAEIVLSPRDYEPNKKYEDTIREIKVLAIFGDSKGIDIQKDKKELKDKLPYATIEFLKEPNKKELHEKLWQKKWDILFFAGHGPSQDENNENKDYIKINEQKKLSIEELKHTLQYSITKGLALAIFNCCDGLELAKELSGLNIPQTIVMREPIVDVVASYFLKNFLSAFSEGQSLNLAVRKARESLEGIEDEYPFATWLPVVFQHPNCKPLTLIPPPLIKYPKLKTIAIATFLVASCFLGMRHLGWLQPLELKAYDQMMQLRPDEPEDNRIVVVEVDGDDIKYEHEQKKGNKKSSLTVSTLKQVIEEIQKDEPMFIGLVQDLDTPDKIVSKQELESILDENPNLYVTCSEKNINKGDALGYLPEIENAFAFSGIIEDNNRVIRRSLLAIDKPNNLAKVRCQSYRSFSLTLAAKYLQKKDIPHRSVPNDPNERLQIGNVILPTFPIQHKHVGGYQKLGDTAGGLQILINYRTTLGRVDQIAPRRTIENYRTPTQTSKNKDTEAVKGNIVLIGVTDKEFAKKGDRLFQTPYQQEITPVWLQAQMISQILSGVINERPFIKPWFAWENIAWICGSSCIWFFLAGSIIWRFRSAIAVLLITGIIIIILYGSCLALLYWQGLWVPFVPPALIVSTTSGLLILYVYSQKIKKIQLQALSIYKKLIQNS